MRKIRCPKCAVINLEGFVTYPNCAGCGARLPQAEKNERAPILKRQVGPLVWATVLGTAILGLVLVASNIFEQQPGDPPSIVMLGRVPHFIKAGDTFTMTLLLDARDGAVPRPDEPLRNVRLRVPRETFRRFALISVSPMPDERPELGTARYFTYEELRRGSQIDLRLRALRQGWQPFSARVLEQNQTSAVYNTRIFIRPVTSSRPTAKN